MVDVRNVITNMGGNVVGDDEIELEGGKRYEDIFEIIDNGRVRSASRLLTSFARQIRSMEA